METRTSSGVPPPLPPKTRRNLTASSPTVPGGGATIQGPMNFITGSDNTQSSITSSGEHVVKIRINPGDSPVSDGCIRISVGGNDHDDVGMVRRAEGFMKERSNPYFFYNSYQCQTNGMVISSGQSSPSDTLDSGTCSDLDGSTPPPLPKKNGAITTSTSSSSSTTVTVTVNGSSHNHHHHNNHQHHLLQHHRTGSLTSSGADVDSDDDVGSNISCDSLNGHELHEEICTVHEEEEEEITPPAEPEIMKSVLTTQLKNVFQSKENILKVVSNTPPAPPMKNYTNTSPKSSTTNNGFLPDSLLQDIRDRTAKLTVVPVNSATLKKTKTWKEEATLKLESHSKSPVTTPEPKDGHQKQQSHLYRYRNSLQMTPTIAPVPEESTVKKNGIVEERTYEERSKERTMASPEPTSRPPFLRSGSYKYEDDRFYKFHLREHDVEEQPVVKQTVIPQDEETFAGVRDLLGNKGSSCTIRSAKGTVRGVKNRVRAGIATFLQFPDTKNYKEKEAGKVVVYTTTMGIVRETYQECLKVKKILRTLLVKYEERDVFMSREVQAEIRERMHCDAILVPQVFVEGQHIGDAETIERLNETGELRRIMKPFKSPDVCNTCQVCGGFRLLPCSVCNGSKKSVHRNDFTAEFVALKCMHCDEVGLVRCYAC